MFTARESSPGARYQPAYTASFGDWRALSGKAGIGRGIVVQPSFLGVDNRVLLQTLQQAPEALRGVAVVADDVNLVEMRRLHEAGVRGIRLNLMGMNDDAEHLRALPSTWWGNLMASGMHLELHADVGRIATLLPWVPSGVTVVLDHFAKPAAANADDPTLRAVQRRAGNGDAVYITLSGVYRLGAATSAVVQCRATTMLARLPACGLTFWAASVCSGAVTGRAPITRRMPTTTVCAVNSIG